MFPKWEYDSLKQGLIITSYILSWLSMQSRNVKSLWGCTSCTSSLYALRRTTIAINRPLLQYQLNLPFKIYKCLPVRCSSFWSGYIKKEVVFCDSLYGNLFYISDFVFKFVNLDYQIIFLGSHALQLINIFRLDGINCNLFFKFRSCFIRFNLSF